MNQHHAMQPRTRVQILGAGITGLSLASFLRARRIPFEIFDSASQPAGHNYGLTLAAWGYGDVVSVLSSRLSERQFHQIIAVDQKIGRDGIISHIARSAKEVGEKVRVSDSLLRSWLASGHSQHISWSHRLSSAQATNKGIQLSFQNGQTSTAPITVDASGDRSALLSLLISNATEPEILPYAVYHGTRFVRASHIDSEYSNLFSDGDGGDKINVREWAVPYQPAYPDAAPTTCYIQISKAYIGFADLPKPIQSSFQGSGSSSMSDATASDTSAKSDQQEMRTVDSDNDEIFVEIRYTVSRPALTFLESNPSERGEQRNNTTSNKDPLYNPTRAKSAATIIPSDFHLELSTILSSPTALSSLPQSLRTTLLDPSSIKHHKDRLLNWLLRMRSHFRPEASLKDLERIADEHGIFVIGDAAHNLPILGSEGANVGMVDAKALANWIADYFEAPRSNEGDDGQDTDIESTKVKRASAFYEDSGTLKRWEEAEAKARAWLREAHLQREDQIHHTHGKEGKL